MAIPDYQTIMQPLLVFAGDGHECSLPETIQALADQFELTQEERAELLPSGRQPIFDNRVGWARTYLKKARLLESTERGVFRVTERGEQVLAREPNRIDNAFLKQFDEFIEFRQRRHNKTADAALPDQSPEEKLEAGYQELEEALADELLQKIKTCSSGFFEELVIDLLLKMGYGGSRREAGRTVGRTGDGGIDGIINEDKLGLDVIYVQAKRWKDTVGRPEIQKFAGALQGQRARKGIFLTTSDFSKDAYEYTNNIENKIILIGGARLAGLMIDHDVGVSTVSSYEVKRIDSDYFISD